MGMRQSYFLDSRVIMRTKGDSIMVYNQGACIYDKK